MSDIDEEYREEPGHLARRFQQIAVAAFQIEMDALGSDITPVQYAALAAINTSPGLDQITLAREIALDRTSVTGVVDRLVVKGLVERQINERDRRARRLLITPEGKETLRRIRPGVEAAQVSMTRGLSKQETELLVSLLKKTVASAKELRRAPMRK